MIALVAMSQPAVDRRSKVESHFEAPYPKANSCTNTLGRT